MMRKSLWITVTVLFVASCAPDARANTYTNATINFTVTGGNVATPPTGSFVYDNTTNEFTSFGVGWETFYDFTDDANLFGNVSSTSCKGSTNAQKIYLMLTSCNDGTTNTITWSGGDPGVLGDGFFIIEGNDFFMEAFHLFGVPHPGDHATGTLTVVTPEPGTVGLILLGFVLVMRKRIAQGAQLAT